MTISIVQSIAFNGAWSGSFDSDVTAGNTVFLFGFQYNNPTMSSSDPEFDGASVPGASQLFFGQSSASYVYGTVWMLPDLAGGAASVSLAHTGGTVDGNVGMVAIEVSGLGASPELDSGATPNPETGTGTTGSVTSGSTGDITGSPELIVAAAIAYGQPAGTPSPWTTLKADPSNNTVAAWQVVTSPGGAYDFTGDTVSTGWFAGVAAVVAAVTNITGTGTVTMPLMAVAGTGDEMIAGAAAVTMAAMAVAGEGTETGSDVTATGAVTMPLMAVAGTNKPPGGGYSLPLLAAGGTI